MYIPQIQLKNLKKAIKPGKAVVIYGPRRTGKTTLLQQYLKEKKDFLFVTGEDIHVKQYLSSCSIQKLKDFIGNKSLLVIDEAQNIENIALNIKLIIDHIPNISIIATGSSTFGLAKNIGEPLTGRKTVLKLYPLSQMELNQIEDLVAVRANLENRLIFGSYPEVILLRSDKEKIEYLHELVSSYLYKDILEIEGIRKSKKITELLQLLAFQVGKEVSYSELACHLGINKATVEKYLDLLEQAFVVVNIRGFSRNLRKEITKNSRYYFYDTGIRNALINNFNFLPMRNDIGMLWENYLACERLKKQAYQNIFSNNYFWRTYDKKELDWVEEHEGIIYGYEFTWSSQKHKHASKLWLDTYKDANYETINRDNYLHFTT